jgi:hypothetical protein
MIEAYQNFIDDMVKVSGRCVTAANIRKNGHAERVNDGLISRIADAPALSAEEASRKSAMLSLTAEQRSVVAELVEQERVGAIHDVLAHLQWATQCDELVLAKEGSEFVEHIEVSFHGDFISRLEDDDW